MKERVSLFAERVLLCLEEHRNDIEDARLDKRLRVLGRQQALQQRRHLMRTRTARGIRHRTKARKDIIGTEGIECPR